MVLETRSSPGFDSSEEEVVVALDLEDRLGARRGGNGNTPAPMPVPERVIRDFVTEILNEGC